MYIEIKDDKLVSWCKNKYENYQYVDIDYDTFDIEKYSIINGVLTDVSSSDEYKAKMMKKEKEAKLNELAEQINIIDAKRIRAIAEPEVKDNTTGQTWLDYYTLQIKNLRAQIANL